MRYLKIPPELDKRRKLTQEDKDEILRLFKQGDLNNSEIARQFGISRQHVGRICDPKLAQKAKEYREQQPKIDKKRNAAAQARYRERKKNLVLDGKIKKG